MDTPSTYAEKSASVMVDGNGTGPDLEPGTTVRLSVSGKLERISRSTDGYSCTITPTTMTLESGQLNPRDVQRKIAEMQGEL